MKKQITLALAALALSTAAHSAEKHLVIVGDELMVYANNNFKAEYHTNAASRLRPYMDVTNISGLGRTMVNAWSYRTDLAGKYAISAFQDNAVVITLGRNDWGQGISLSTFEDRYKRLLYGYAVNTTAKRYCATPVRYEGDSLPRLNKLGHTLEQYRNVVRKMASSGACKLVPADKWFSFGDVYNATYYQNGQQLTPAGHSRYASKLRTAIGF